MNKIEIQAIKEYCHTISDLCNEINYGFEGGKYIAFFDIDLMGWTIQVRTIKPNSQKVWRMDLNSLCDIAEIEYELYEPTEENFILAIKKLQGYLKEMQEDEVLDRVRTYR